MLHVQKQFEKEEIMSFDSLEEIINFAIQKEKEYPILRFYSLP